MGSSLSNQDTIDGKPHRGGGLGLLSWPSGWAYVSSVALTIVFFVADVILPRGATVAIGYCVVPGVAAGTRRLGFLYGMTITCTVLTWMAFFAEPADYSGWKSMFDRSMVTAVIWLAFLVVSRRSRLIRELAGQRRALEIMTLELGRSNDDLSNFASVVAHDLRGRLNTMGLFSQILSRSSPLKADPECGEHLGSIRAEIARMSDFIQSLLSYGRVGSGDLRLQDCDCASVLNDVRRNLTIDVERSCTEISNDPLPIIRADPMLITQLFQNLIENSIKYRSKGMPRVHVAVAQQSDGWLFSVRDNGIGIRPDDCERIFKPFCQTEAARSLGSGVGLGLATCKKIVERHGGQIYVQSIPGEGATFLFTIPEDFISTKPATFWAMTEKCPSVPQFVAMK